MKNIIIGIIGAIGTGKTLSAVYLSYLAWRYNNFIIMSNMKELKFQQYYIRDPINLLDFDYEENKNYLYIDDEAYVTLDSSGRTKKVKERTYAFLQTRKNNVSVIYTAQLPKSVDKRLRANTFYYILPSNLKEIPELNVISLKWNIFNYIESYENDEPPDKSKNVLIPKGIFKLYNTNEKIKPEVEKD